MNEMIGHIFGSLQNADKSISVLNKHVSLLRTASKRLAVISFLTLGVCFLQERRLRKMDERIETLESLLSNAEIETKTIEIEE